MSTYAIGDIQGCCNDFERLLDVLKFDPATDHVWIAGDLVNRGPQSLRTLRTICALGARAQVILGNHDLHLLAAAQGVRPLAPSDTLAEILDAPDAAELLHWVRHRKLAHADDEHLMVHAGILPQWSRKDVLKHALELETVLQSDQWGEFLANMYGNKPDQWDEKLAGWERLRVAVNVFTRLRFCTAKGKMDFKTKEGAGGAPEGYMPWFDVPGRRTEKTTVIFGHWSTLGLVIRPNLMALDTGCVWGGQLTAVRLEDRALFQIPCQQHQRPG